MVWSCLCLFWLNSVLSDSASHALARSLGFTLLPHSRAWSGRRHPIRKPVRLRHWLPGNPQVAATLFVPFMTLFDRLDNLALRGLPRFVQAGFAFFVVGHARGGGRVLPEPLGAFWKIVDSCRRAWFCCVASPLDWPHICYAGARLRGRIYFQVVSSRCLC